MSRRHMLSIRYFTVTKKKVTFPLNQIEKKISGILFILIALCLSSSNEDESHQTQWQNNHLTTMK